MRVGTQDKDRRSRLKAARGLAKHLARRRVARIVWSMAGLPIAVRAAGGRIAGTERIVRRAYARLFLTRRTPIEWLDLGIAAALAPVMVPAWALSLTWKNRTAATPRAQRHPVVQWADQIRLYLAAGVLPPWYYIFELYRDPSPAFARGYIYRCESKGGCIPMLKAASPPSSVVSDKVAFERRCRDHGVATVPILAVARGGALDWQGTDQDRRRDWFVKPIDGKGGKGIERWDHVGDGRFEGPDGRRFSADDLLSRIAARSAELPCFVQPRLVNHPDLRPLANDALSTIRALSCIAEDGRPELVGAVLRMAVGTNRVVDNFHAGGIAAPIDLQSGILGPASNLGVDARLGWLDRHPVSGAPIAGTRVPGWTDFAPFVEQAHRAFADRLFIGWDIAITGGGPVVVEANGGPDLDIMQRIPRQGAMNGRLGQLLAFHVARVRRG